MKPALLGLLVMMTGCASQSGLGRASTLAPGRAQLSPLAELSFVSARFEANQPSTAPWVLLGLGYRRGVTEKLELGVRAWGFGWPQYFTTVGLGFDAKVQVFQASGWHVAVAPSGRYHVIALGNAPWHVFGLELPLLIGKDLGPHQLVFGVKLADFLLTGAGTNAINSVWAGAHVGVAFKLTRSIEFMPEVGVLWSPVPFNGETADPQRNGASVLNLGVSVSADVGVSQR